MTDPAETNEEPPKQGGQVLGCIFSIMAAVFIFFAIFVFMRSCG